MTTIIVKDALRQSVETASEGRQTVLRTAKGSPSYFNVIPAFNCEDINPNLGTGRHPAFVVNGIEKPEIFIGTYQAIIHDNEAISLPYQNPKARIDFDDARAACVSAGPGFHLMTNWEWAAVALWMVRHGYGDAHGNTDYGESHIDPAESGLCGEHWKTLTGSGPASWRHDGSMYGIADLVGNVWEWNDGLKLVSGKIIMPSDNAFELSESEWPDTGISINGMNGIHISDKITDRGWLSKVFKDVAGADGHPPTVALKQALLCPLGGMDVPGHFYADNTDGFEALPVRGGSRGVGAIAGLAGLTLNNARSFVHTNIGFRPAFIA
jgi:sulfatase modifying factor 1